MLRQILYSLGAFCAVMIAPAVSYAVTGDASVKERGFRYYPGFVRKNAVIEAAHDKGLIVEYIVRCSDGPGMITLSKVERKYCLPNNSCTGNLQIAVRRLCR